MSTKKEPRVLGDTNGLAPRVYQLAQLVCRELEILRESHGETTYQSLLPLSLRILEEMNQIYSERNKLDLDLNLQVAEKNDILFQLERANKLRFVADQRVHYLEDELIGLKKDSQLKIEKLESLLRHREMLTRNAEEHALRLEERDAQLQTELNAAQDRYNELLRAHVDLLERNKLAGSDCGSQRTTVFEHLDVTKSSVNSLANDQNYPLDGTKVSDPNIYDPRRPNDDEYLVAEPSVLLAPMRSADRVSSFINLLDESMDCESVVAPSTTTDAEDDDEAVRISEAADCTENSYGMMKEVEKLISENMELSATKNALNVVKNDLIRKLDDVTGEKLLLTRELESIRLSRDQTRNEANRLVRQVHDCQNKISHLVARLKLYEDVDEIALNNLRQSSAHLPHATSCLVLNTDSVSSLAVPSAPLTNLKTMSKMSGSMNCMNVKKDRRVAASMMNLTTTHPVLVTEGSSGVACPSSDTTRLDEAMRNAKLGEPCFTKREMARVIAERNHYKESFIELQEALRHMESLRAERFGEDGRSGSRLRTHSNSPINSRSNRPISLAQQILVAIQNAAGDFANGVSGFFLDMEPLFVPSVPSEAQQHYMDFSSDWSPQSTSADLPGGAHSSELRRMFSHLIGHAAGHGTEAFLGAGNDFAATVNSQSLTNTTQRLLDRHYASQASASPDHVSAVPGSSHHPRNRTPSNILSSLPTSATNVCTRPMASVGSPTVGRGQGANSHRDTSTNPTKLSDSSRENVLDEALVIQ